MTQTQRKPALLWRISQILQILIQPHPSAKERGEAQRAQLLSAFTLFLSVLFFGALFTGSNNINTILVDVVLSVAAYILSRTKYHRLGAYLFTYGITTSVFWTIYQGPVVSISSTIAITIHITLILASILLTPIEFLPLAILTIIATYTAPRYAQQSILRLENVNAATGSVALISVLLYAISSIRVSSDSEYNSKMKEINESIRTIREGFEKRIAEQKVEIQKSNQQSRNYSARLHTISEISKAITISSPSKLNDFLTMLAGSISERLGFYHVGIFLLNETRQYAVLQAANSEGGKQMLAHHHQLRVGGTGIVGYVAQGGLLRTALDTGTDAIYFNNPYLLKTRSEIALPLKTGQKVIGVLDVQSTEPSAFNEEDILMLEIIAQELSITLDRLLQSETGKTSSLAQLADGQVAPLSGAVKAETFSYLPDGTLSTEKQLTDNPVFAKIVERGETVIAGPVTTGNVPTLAVPVKLRDQVIGVIHIEAAEPNRKWTEDEIAMVQAVSERAALALENAQLFAQTARRAEQERIVAQVTSRIGESNDMDRILHTTIQELGRLFGTSRTFIQMTGTQATSLPDRSTKDEKENL